MSPLAGLRLVRSRAREVGRREPRAHNAPSSGRMGGRWGCRCLAHARVVKEGEKEDKNEKTRGRRGGASAAGAELTSARVCGGAGGRIATTCLINRQRRRRRRRRRRRGAVSGDVSSVFLANEWTEVRQHIFVCHGPRFTSDARLRRAHISVLLVFASQKQAKTSPVRRLSTKNAIFTFLRSKNEGFQWRKWRDTHG